MKTVVESSTKHRSESTIAIICSVVGIAIDTAQRQSSLGPRHVQFLVLDSFLCRYAACGCHCFALGPARGARPFPVGCAPPDPPFPSTSHASCNAPPSILHAPPHAHPPLCPCVPLELPARPLVMLPPAYPQAFPCHAIGPPPPCASPDNAKRQALAAPARH